MNWKGRRTGELFTAVMVYILFISAYIFTTAKGKTRDFDGLTSVTSTMNWTGVVGTTGGLNLEELRQLYDELNVDSLSDRAVCFVDPKEVESNNNLTTIQLLEREGSKHETHFIRTKDNYIFQVHRIPAPGKPPVYVLPGLFQSSRDLLLNCQGRALGYKLFNAGYDVWLGNFRGNSYGRNHTTLTPDQKQFWEFKIDDLISYDAPAAVDYILENTDQKKLSWIGFSMGNTILFGLLAALPEYNDKINVGIALAPAVYFGQTSSNFEKSVSKNWPMIEDFTYKHFHGELLPPDITSMLHHYGPMLCEQEAMKRRPGACSVLLGYIDGKDPRQTNYAYLPQLLGGFPSTTSGRVFCQYLQWISTSKNSFCKFDYGHLNNVKKYGSPKPPEYNLQKITAPIVTFWGESDMITTKDDVKHVVRELPTVEANIRVKSWTWNHIDFLYGKDADALVYDFVIYILNEKQSKSKPKSNLLTV